MILGAGKLFAFKRRVTTQSVLNNVHVKSHNSVHFFEQTHWTLSMANPSFIFRGTLYDMPK